MEKKSEKELFDKIFLMGVLGGSSCFKQVYSVYNICGCSPTITTSASHGNGMPYILIEEKEDERDLERYSGL